MNLVKLVLVIMVCTLWLSPQLRAVGDADVAVLGFWTRPGTEWLVHVRQYSRGWAVESSNSKVNEEGRKPKVQCEFHMRITVLEPQGEHPVRVAQIKYTPLDDAPDFMRGSIRVIELDAASGKVKAIKEVSEDKGSGVESVAQIGAEKLLFTRIYGFPVDWIVSASDVSVPAAREEDRSVINREGDSFIKKRRPSLTADQKQQAIEIEASTAWLDAEPRTRVVQTWVPGEGWWRSYTRYIQGHIDLEATLVEDDGEEKPPE